MADNRRPGRYRILYHHRTQDADGQRVHIRAIQDALQAQGHEVVEVSPVRATEVAGAPLVPTARRRLFNVAVRLAPRGVYELLQWLYNVVGYVALSRAIRRVRPDFIYERYSLNTIAGVWASKRLGVPLLLEVNSPLATEQRALGKVLFSGVATWAEAYALRRATRVLVVSRALRDTVAGQSDIERSRILVIPNAVDPETFDRARTRRGPLRGVFGVGSDVAVGSVAFFHPWHGLDLLLACLARSPALRGVRVILVGDGPALPPLKAATARLGIADRVIFTGAVPHGDVPGFIAALDVAVLPRAVRYASPLKLFEYMAAGKAIVAPRQANLLEVLIEGENALCFEPESEAELQACLEAVCADGNLRRRLGAAARATIDERGLTWAGNARRIIDVYEGLTQPLWRTPGLASWDAPVSDPGGKSQRVHS